MESNITKGVIYLSMFLCQAEMIAEMIAEIFNTQLEG